MSTPPPPSNVNLEVSVEKEKQLVEKMKSKLNNKFTLDSIKPGRINVVVSTDNIVEVSKVAKSFCFDQVSSVAGTDFPSDNEFEVVYHVACVSNSRYRDIVLELSTRIKKSETAKPVIDSLYDVWRSCDWHEKETHEMLGIVFKGNPELRRVLLPEDWNEIPPLRKDYILPGR